jgi:hypothetical protein
MTPQTFGLINPREYVWARDTQKAAWLEKHSLEAYQWLFCGSVLVLLVIGFHVWWVVAIAPGIGTIILEFCLMLILGVPYGLSLVFGILAEGAKAKPYKDERFPFFRLTLYHIAEWNQEVSALMKEDHSSNGKAEKMRADLAQRRLVLEEEIQKCELLYGGRPLGATQKLAQDDVVIH